MRPVTVAPRRIAAGGSMMPDLTAEGSGHRVGPGCHLADPAGRGDRRVDGEHDGDHRIGRCFAQDLGPARRRWRRDRLSRASRTIMLPGLHDLAGLGADGGHDARGIGL